MALLTASCREKSCDARTQATKKIKRSALPAGTFKNGVVVCNHPIASQVGADILKKGGNAVDAAVASFYALAVVFPDAGNIGGGGFMIIRSANGDIETAIDFRETAPAKAFRDMYLDKDGDVVMSMTRDTALASGVPGSVAGTMYALEKYGTMTPAQVLAPAIKLAQQGFVLDYPMGYPYKENDLVFELFPETKKYFKKPDGSIYDIGERFIQKDLAKTLTQIARSGRDGFYKGPVADLIIKTMEKYDGIITHQDLEEYNPIERKPVKGTYRDCGIVSMPPSSSGGITLIEILNMLENYDIKKLGLNTTQTVHLLTEANKLAFADRAKYIADPAFIPVPTETLVSKQYAAERMKAFNPNKATPSSQITHGQIVLPPKESTETTHMSIIDKNGLAVATTTSLCRHYGSWLAVDGAGFMLNNEMQDFSAKIGVPDKAGLVYGEENSIGPHKRMLSSMTPTIVTKNGKNFMIIGTPGGPKIISITAQTIMDIIDFQMDITQAVDCPKVHHQWLPDQLDYENLSDKTIEELKALGHNLAAPAQMGSTQAIMIDPKTGLYTAKSDTRRKPQGMACGY